MNEIRREFNINEFDSNLVNNIISKHEEFDESSKRNVHFIRPRYVVAEITTEFSFAFIPRETTSFEEISLTPISQQVTL